MTLWRLRSGERRLILLLGDLTAAAAAMMLALYLWGQVDFLGPTIEFVQTRAQWFVYVPLVWPPLMVNLYDLQRAAVWRETVRGVLTAAAVGLLSYVTVYFVLNYFQPEGEFVRRGVFYFLAGTVVLTLAWRWLYIRALALPASLRRVLVVGAGESGSSLVEIVNQLQPAPYRIVGLIDDDPTKLGQQVSGVPVLGDSRALLDIVRREGISDLLVAILGPMNGEMFQALLDAQQVGIGVQRMPVAYEELLARVPIQYLESDWLLRSFVDEVHVSGFYLLGKRLVDILGAALGLSLLLALLPWAGLAILLDSGRPIFFRQQRMGQGGRVFRIVKLRTMRQDAEADGQPRWANERDPRMTRVGKLLRRTHLDEFPQFWNVLRGDMSLVGPRPERPELVAQLERTIPFYRARLLVKPGVTGWAQVNYGKGGSVEGSAEKLEYDLYYIKHRSLWMDFWIILRTIGSVFGFRGV